MTAIIGYVDKKNKVTYLGADSMGSNGFTGQLFKTNKIIQKNGLSIAYSGDYRGGQILNSVLEPRKFLDSENVEDYLFSYLANDLREGFKDNGFMKIKDNVETLPRMNFIIAIKDRLFIYQKNNAILEPEGNFIASGSGEYHIQACLEALYKHSLLSPREMIEEAIRIASKYVLSVGGNAKIITHKHD